MDATVWDDVFFNTLWKDFVSTQERGQLAIRPHTFLVIS
jgi:hypothetical protein